MEEELILEKPRFRRELAQLDVAQIWISPALDGVFHFERDAGTRFEAMLTALADESGYDELASAPVIPIGHSAAASFPWNFAAWKPERTLAVISVSGEWPISKNPAMPEWGHRSIDGVPGLVSIGEYEWAEDRAKDGLAQRAAHSQWPLSMLAEPGGGHFDCSDAKIDYLALYVRKACEYRLPDKMPAEGIPKLKSIDPRIDGWLVERWRRDRPPTTAAAPVDRYAGNSADAFWYFDEEMARATETFGERDRGKQVQLLGYVQQDAIVPQDAKTHQQVTLRFLPEGDGKSFQIDGTFLDEVPAGRPERWTGKKAGSSIDHGVDTNAIQISRICGPVRHVEGNTFTLQFDHLGFNNNFRGRDIWLIAEHLGDDKFRRSVQQSLMRFPLKNTKGTAQHISFPKIEDCRVDADPIHLRASSDGGGKVEYYVLAGPAEIDGDKLHITPIPPDSRFPVKVTVVAWQWGRSTPPLQQTAQPVEQTFYVQRELTTKAFIHPGLLHTREDLIRIKQHVAAGDEPWKTGFVRLEQHWQSQSDYTMFGPYPRVVRDPDESLYNAAMVADGNAAYQNALMWCITGDEAHARKAVEILDRWSETLQEMSGRDVQLGAGLNGFKFVNAAELMRATYPRWSADKIAQCQRMFKQAIYPPIKDFATFANGNWDGACIKTIMAIGVFCDDREVFDRGVEYFQHGTGNGRLTHYIINDSGQCQESGRDQGHTQLGLGQLADACEIGWNQGIDLYGTAENRLLAGFEYTAKYLLGEDVPFVPFTDTTGKYSATSISTRSRSRIRPIYEMVWNHYECRRGIAAPYTRKLAQQIRPEGPAHMADHPGFGTLLFSREPTADIERQKSRM
jgi:Alginate lyase